MMQHINGMHAPNGGYSFNEQLLNDVATGGLVLMDWQLRNNPYTQMWSNTECDNWVWARVGCPAWPGGDPRGIFPNAGRILGIRMYQTDWREHFLTLDGGGTWRIDIEKCKAEARRAAELLTSVRGGKFHPDATLNLLADDRVILWPMNEPDIEPLYVDGLSNSPTWYDLIGNAWQCWATELKRIMGRDLKAKLASTPLAGGHDMPGAAPDAEYQRPAMREMLLECDVVNAHVYGLLNQNEAWGAIGDLAPWFGLRLWRERGYKNRTEGWTGGDDPGGLFTQYPDKLKLISECGFFRHSLPVWTDIVKENFIALYERAEQDGNVVLVCPFIWDSDGKHQDNRICPNEQLRFWFRTMPRYAGADLNTAPTPKPDPEPTPEPTPSVNFGKVTWFLEEAQRAAEGEGLAEVSKWIGDHYTTDAIQRRDGSA